MSDERPDVERVGYRFAQVPEWILFHEELSAQDVRVYAVLDRYDGTTCIPGLQTVGSRVGVSEDTVKRSIVHLEAVGAVFVEARYVADRRTTNRYLLATESPFEQRSCGADRSDKPGQMRTRPRKSEGDGPRKSEGDGPRTDAPAEREQEEREQEERGTEGGETSSDVATAPAAPSPKAKRATQLPVDWDVDHDLVAWAQRDFPQLDLRRETEQFLDFHRAKGSVMKDWKAAWRTWIRNAARFAANGRGSPGPRPGPVERGFSNIVNGPKGGIR